MIPLGQCCEAETTSSHYSFHFGPSHLFINLLFLPRAPLAPTFVSYIFTDAPPGCCKPPLHLTPSLFFLLLNILPYQSSTMVLWFLHCSSSSAPFKRLHQTNSIIKVKSELELWTVGFSPQGHFPSGEATVYTGWCAHAGTRKQPHSCM